MPAANAYRRAPLVDPAYVALTDAAVHTGGLLQTLIDRALKLVDVEKMSALDAVLATKLGGYTQAPPSPDVESASESIADAPRHFIDVCSAAAMTAVMNRDKEAMLRILDALRALKDSLPLMSEEKLFSIGADALRLSVDLYRRTGQPFLLELLESLRARLPDVSGLMHMFPFQSEYQPQTDAQTAQEKEYYDRMQRFATGKYTADSVAMTALLSQYSGSGRDAAAPKAGLNALSRFHGMPSGAFSADPYLAGRDPARAVELPAACAQAEALCDVLLSTGEASVAERMEMIVQNVLADLVTEDGVRTLSPASRLSDDDSCETVKPEAEEISAVLRALHAVRRCVWLSRDDDTVALMLPMAGGCVTRLGGVPVRLTAEEKGVFTREITIRVECRQPVSGTVLVRVPAYADGAQVAVNGNAQPAPQGQLFPVRRTFQNGDVITLTMTLSPRMENGWRGSVSVYVGAQLMALPLPEKDASWRYAVIRSLPVTQTEDGGMPCALLTACEAPQWREKKGFIAPPPQNVIPGSAYELTLIPFAGRSGRITAFPCVTER